MINDSEYLDLTMSRHQRRGRCRYRSQLVWTYRSGHAPAPFALVSRKSDVLSQIGRYEQSARLLADYLARAESCVDRHWAAVFSSDLAGTLRIMGQPGSAVPHAERARALFPALHDDRGLANAIYNLSCIYFDLSQYDLAQQHLRELLEIADRTGQLDLSAKALYGLRDELERGYLLTTFRNYLEKARRSRDRPLMAIVYFYLGDFHLTAGEWAQAEECNRSQYQLAQETGNRMGMSYAIGDRGLIYDGQGRHREAIECYLEKLRISEEMADSYNIYEALSNLGAAHMLLGEYQPALGYFRQAEAHSRRHQIMHHLCMSLSLVAHCLFELGRHGQAVIANQEALVIACEIDHPPVIFSGSLLEARIAALDDRPRAIAKLENLLPQAANDEGRADVHLELYRLTGDPLQRQEALRYYRQYFDQSKLHYVNKRIEELSA